MTLQIIFECIICALIVIGYIHEDEVIAFEQRLFRVIKLFIYNLTNEITVKR